MNKTFNPKGKEDFDQPSPLDFPENTQIFDNSNRNYKGETPEQEIYATHNEGCECDICKIAKRQYEQDRLFERGVWKNHGRAGY